MSNEHCLETHVLGFSHFHTVHSEYAMHKKII
jgi:hypothetical protein